MPDYTLPDFNSAALITIDTQRDTLDGQPFEIAGTSAILPTMRALLNAFRKAARPIVHVVRIYLPDGSNVDLCRRESVEAGSGALLAGSAGCQLASELTRGSEIQLNTDVLLSGGKQMVAHDEEILFKPRWGAFYQTALDAHLRACGVSTVVFTGCNFPNCPRTSIYEASERDYRIVLVEDAVSGLYDRGREEMENIGVAVMTSHDVLQKVLGVRLA